jgi:hypothetical protein
MTGGVSLSKMSGPMRSVRCGVGVQGFKNVGSRRDKTKGRGDHLKNICHHPTAYNLLPVVLNSLPPIAHNGSSVGSHMSEQ